MKKALLLLSLLLITAAGFTQQAPEPVKWTFSAAKLADRKYEIHMTAVIEKGWHIYSQATPDGGPVKTTVHFGKNALLAIEGSVREVGNLEQHFEKLFDVEVRQYSGKVDFVQVVTLKAKAKTNITGSIQFMACDDVMCLPPRMQAFNIPLK